jgi:hypothetical protein
MLTASGFEAKIKEMYTHWIAKLCVQMRCLVGLENLTGPHSIGMISLVVWNTTRASRLTPLDESLQTSNPDN